MFRRRVGERSLPDSEDSATQNSASNIPEDTFSEKAGEITGWVIMGLLLGLLGKIVFNIAFP